MIDKYGLKNIIWIVAGLTLLSMANSARAEDVDLPTAWNCVDLLDAQTKSALAGDERFFTGLYQVPSQYQLASERDKKWLVNRWIKQLQGNDYERIARAAAYLGLIKAKSAAKSLEKVIASGKGGGLIRSVSTRSLGQIGNTSSIPILISLGAYCSAIFLNGSASCWQPPHQHDPDITSTGTFT